MKLEPNEDGVLVLPDSEDDICIAVDLFDISPFHLRSTTPTSSKILVDVDRYPYNPLYMRLACQRAPFSMSTFHY